MPVPAIGTSTGSGSRATDCTAILQAAQFVRTPHFISAKHTTAASGISSLLPNAKIDDYVFEPCGYSMNGLEGDGFSTIHITPEEAFSYASLELSGYHPSRVNPSGVIAEVRRIAARLRASKECVWE